MGRRIRLNEEEMNLICEMRGHKLASYIKPKGYNTYRVRMSEQEYNALCQFRKTKAVNADVKVLIFDIETAPIKALVWSRWKQNIYLEQTISEWFMLCWAAKWVGGEIMSDCLTPDEAIGEDDKRITKTLWYLFNEADIIIAHNGSRFDVPKMNSRFAIHGLKPPTPYRQIDTKQVSAKQFGFSSNKLDALAGYFGIRYKDKTDFELWVRCLKGEQEALDYMRKYNEGDVEILEKVYFKLRPWIKNHPNLSLYIESDEEACPFCGSHNLNETGTFYYTQVSKFSNLRCADCDGIARRRVSEYPKSKRRNLVTAV